MEFTHFDTDGNAWMVDISGKDVTRREAVACGRITMSEECFQKVKTGQVKKGDVLAVARIAGIMGAKKTSDLIPLCHNLNLTGLEVWFEMEEEACAIKACCKAKTTGRTGVEMEEESHAIKAYCKAKTTGKTGVEMEALTGVQVALLTVYDMCKAVDKRMMIQDVRLLQKSGGKSGDFHA